MVQAMRINKAVFRYIEFELYSYEQTKRRDKDNVAFAKKFILDALQKSGVLKNDNNKYILGFQDEFVYRQGDKVVVEIWEVV